MTDPTHTCTGQQWNRSGLPTVTLRFCSSSPTPYHEYILDPNPTAPSTAEPCCGHIWTTGTFWIKPQHISARVDLASATRTINLEPQPSEIQIWTASCTSPIPPAYLDKAKPTLLCFGAHLRIAGDSEGLPRGTGWKAPPWLPPRCASETSRLHNPRPQPSRTQNADSRRPTHYVRGCSLSARPTHDFRAATRKPLALIRKLWPAGHSSAGRDVTSPLFHLPLRMGGLGVGSAVQRHAAAPWTAWQTVIPTLMAATDSSDTDSLLAATPTLRGQLLQLQSTLALQMNTPALIQKPLGAALRTHDIQKHWSAPSDASLMNRSWTLMSTTPFREPSSSPKRPKTQTPTFSSRIA